MAPDNNNNNNSNKDDNVHVLTADSASPRLSRAAIRALGASIGDAFSDDPVFRYYLRLPPFSSSASSSSETATTLRLRLMWNACVRYVALKSSSSTSSSSTSPLLSASSSVVVHYASDYSSAAVWAFDNVWHDKSGQLHLLFNMFRTFGFTQVTKFLRTFSQVETQHPHFDDTMDVSVTPSLEPCKQGESSAGKKGVGVVKAPRHAYLWVVGTSPSVQGRGVGSKVMRKMLRRLDEERMPAYLETSSERNVPFYQRLGFEKVRRLDIDDDECPPMWAMWRVPRAANANDGDDGEVGMAGEGGKEMEKKKNGDGGGDRGDDDVDDDDVGDGEE